LDDKDAVKTRLVKSLLGSLVLLVVPAATAAERAAVFEFEFIDTSLDGEILGMTAEEKARIAKMAPMARELLAKYGFESVDIAPVAEKAKNSNLQSCGFCDAAMAKELGATVAVTGTVQKVSNLILNINLYFRDADTNTMEKVGSVDIRGNTDESWFRGLKYLVKNRLFKGVAPQ
jgi:Protein of unknown function (DUF2380)